ncbi:peptide chain release factor-like protein [bacterium]|nr:peptide chain release factor-like protein [bacterium]
MNRDDWLALSDERLLGSCHEDFYRASGPGGQKRNKTESAVRLRHQETGLIVVATESRSRQENRERALRRMREAIAFRLRLPVSESDLPPILMQAVAQGLRVSKRHESFLMTSALILDRVDHDQGKVSMTADQLSVATSSLVRFLKTTPELWEATQQLRDKHGLAHLR